MKPDYKFPITNYSFTTMKTLTLLFSFFLFTTISFSQASEDSLFQQFLKQQQQGIQEQEEQFFQYQQRVTEEYRKYEEEQKKAFQDYLDNIEKQWGERNTKTSTKKEWVSYDKDYKSRRSVDFEKGEAKVEVLIEPSQANNKDLIQQKIKEEISKMVADKGNDDPLSAKEKSPEEKQPILADQLQTKDKQPVTAKNVGQFAEQILRVSETKQEEVKGKDGEKRIAVIITVPLVPDHLRKRAITYKENVQNESQRFKIDPTLVFAVVHTESYFNPKARSGVPAYGLMQLVPKSGGRDAYLYVYKVDSLLTPEYLYTPENNVELGAAYLNILLTKYFKEVKDEQSRLYCAVASYNTGAGNVARAFTGKTKLKPAIEKINAMTSDEVFAHLKSKLPYKETQDYIIRVTERMKNYEEWK
ncbi:MAG: DUF3393 domain-containing protein [Ignavibacteriales bacterium]|nr:DUF3393 domain-containing protein [Ignavibacteriales bacterium]